MCSSRLLLAAVTISLTVLAPGLASTTIDVSDSVETSGAKRLGVNLGGVNFWDASQYMKELVFRNPGFEPYIFQSMARVETGTATSFVDDNPYAAWPDGFWNGASYEVMLGSALGRTGTVTSSTAPSGSTGTTYQLDGGGTALANGDLVVTRKLVTGVAEEGWWPDTGGGGTVSTELSDLPPGTSGVQAIGLSAGPGEWVDLNAYFDSSAGETFLQLNGDYRLEFQAKATGGSGQLQVLLRRLATTNVFVDQTVTLSGSWTTQTFDFSASETGDIGTMQLLFGVADGSSVLLDEVSLHRRNGDPTNPTAFADPMVDALRTLRPGLLRHWAHQLGDSLDNQVAEPMARMRSGYIAWSLTGDDLDFGLHEFLELCESVGAEPWYVVPITFSTSEMAGLVEYLAGPASSPWGARRAARGRTQPWTDAFSTIHLEFGNEAWNSIFKGGTIEYPDAYGARGDILYRAARSSPWFTAGDFDLVLGGQAAWVGRNTAIHAASSENDSLALAPYLMGSVDNYANDEELFGPLFAEPEMVNQVDYMRQNHDAIQTSSRPIPLAVYEVNLHTTSGSISQAALDAFTPSLGAGLAVADHTLMMMKDLDIRNQMIFSLPQFQFRRSDGKLVRLWGIVRDMGVTDRRRPQYLAMMLANEAIAGDLVVTTHSGDDPTWDQPLLNGVQYNGAHYLRSYAFSGGGGSALIVFNLHRTSPLDVDFTGVNAPSGSVTIRTLTSTNLTDTNEDAENVTVSTQSVSNFDPSQLYALPPYSMTVFLTGGGRDFVVGEGLGAPNTNRVRVHRPDGSFAGVDFQAYGSGRWGTNVESAAVMSGSLQQILTGPGPGSVYGPHVRAFWEDGAPVTKVSFYAYGTLKFGANVGAGDLDGDPFGEILTGAGPGAVFGPHVRAFNVDGGALTPISKINLFAYATLKFGVNARSGDVDADGFAELLTGPGPGAIFGPQVRGFDYDNTAVQGIAKINFAAFTVPQYGVNLDGGDADADGFAEIAVTPGPGPGTSFPSRFRGFDYDGASVAQLPGFDATPFTTLYGGRVALGDVNDDGADDLLAGAGRDPGADSRMESFSYDGAALTQLANGFLPFTGSTYGVNPGSGDLGY